MTTVRNDRISVNEHLVETFGKDSCEVFLHNNMCDTLKVDACCYLPRNGFIDVVGNKHTEGEINNALLILQATDQLTKHYQYIDADDESFDIEREDVLEAQMNSQICHPETGIMVVALEENISVYYSATDNLKEQLLSACPPETGIYLTDKELATVLGALRYWQHSQKYRTVSREEDGHFYDHDPLNNEEIDTLCERINT